MVPDKDFSINDYRYCKVCGSEVLYQIEGNHYIGSGDFVEGFPGWCYPCLMEYCSTHECESCTATANPSDCLFLKIKNNN
jgi:hypothetical protein